MSIILVAFSFISVYNELSKGIKSKLKKAYNMTALNKASLNAIADKLNTVLNTFHSGSTIVVFKGNNTVVMSSKVHSEASLLEYLNGATTVRICT